MAWPPGNLRRLIAVLRRPTGDHGEDEHGPQGQDERKKPLMSLRAMTRSSQRRLNPAAHNTACSASPSDPLSQQRCMPLSCLASTALLTCADPDQRPTRVAHYDLKLG